MKEKKTHKNFYTTKQKKKREKREKGKKKQKKHIETSMVGTWPYSADCPSIFHIYLPNASKMCDDMMSETYLRTGLDRAIGVATPNALIRCCIVGVADVIRIAAPGWLGFGPLIIWSGDIASGLYPRVTSRPLLWSSWQEPSTNIFFYTYTHIERDTEFPKRRNEREE